MAVIARHLIDLAILAGIIYFAALTYGERSAISALDRELKPRQATLGELKVVDPAKIYVKALRTESPFDFAWRVYLPKNHGTVELLTMGNGEFPRYRSRGGYHEPKELVIRASLRQYDQLYTLQVYGGVAPLDIIKEMKVLPAIESIQQLLDPKLAAIRQVGTDGTQEFSTEDDIELLKVVVRDSDGGQKNKPLRVTAYLPSASCLLISSRHWVEGLSVGNEAASEPAPARLSRPGWRRVLKIPLRTALLLMTLVASWLALRVSQAEKFARQPSWPKPKRHWPSCSSMMKLSSGWPSIISAIAIMTGKFFCPVVSNMNCVGAANRLTSIRFPTPTGTLALKPGLHRVQLVASWRDHRKYLVTLTVDGIDTQLGDFAQGGSRHDFLKYVGPAKVGKSVQLRDQTDSVLLYQQPTDRPLEIIRGVAKDPFKSAFPFPGYDQFKGDMDFKQYLEMKEEFEGPQGLLEALVLWVRAIPQ